MKALSSMTFAALIVLTLGTPLGADELTEEEGAIITQSFEMSMQARDLFYEGRFKEAEVLMREVVALNRSLPNNELSIASSLHNLAAALGSQGNLREAESLARTALELRLAHGGVDFVIISTRTLLASILSDLSQFQEARMLQQEAVALGLSSQTADPVNLVQNITTLAYYTAEDGYVADGIGILNEIAPMIPDLPDYDVVRLLNALGRLSSMNGQPQAAETYYREALARQTPMPDGPDWSARDKATVVGNLASILRGQGRYHEALGLFLTADNMMVSAHAAQSESRATILDGLGESHRELGQFEEAFATQRLALDIRLAILPEGNVRTGISFSNLGLTLLQAGHIAEARQALSKAVQIQRENGDPIRFANAAMNLSGALAASGATEEATLVAQEAQTAMAKVLDEAHPSVVRAGFNQAWMLLAAGKNQAAHQQALGALAAYEAKIWQAGTERTVGAGAVRDTRRQILAAVVSTWEVNRDAGIEDAFRAAQWAQASKAAQVSQRVAARFATGEGELSTLARQKQTLVDTWQATDAQYLALLSQAPQGDPRIGAVQSQIATLEGQIKTLDAELDARFPQFKQLTQPSTTTIAQIQATLGPSEALLMPITTLDETYVFAITQDDATWQRTPLTSSMLGDYVRRLRADLNPTETARGAEALDDDFAQDGLRDFDAEAAHALHDLLIAPVSDVLAGSETIYVVKEGALSGLPLSILLQEPTSLDGGDAEAFSQAPWLLRQHAIATIPSPQAFVSQRALTRSRQPTAPLVGFADPVFSGAENAPSQDIALLLSRGVGNTAGVQNLARLPGTRRELLELARVTQARADDVFLGADATETRVKTNAALRNANVLVFATHGLISGELSGLAEPALAFTPPDTATAMDDGLLTASEAANLDLVADWVILSACNTASADGTPGGEGLSGLASAFLFAGARALVVSHWPVRDDAAPVLTVGMLRAEGERPKNTKAQHLRQAMLDLIDSGTIPQNAHPSTWAPFVVVAVD